MSDLRMMLDALGVADDEHLSMGTQLPGGKFSGSRVPVAALRNGRTLQQDRHVWIGTVVLGAGSGRGEAEDALRLPAFWADLDVKPGGLPTWAAAEAVIEDLSKLLGAHPIYVVMSGHGLQPVWRIADDTPEDRDRAVALLRRWGLLVQRVARDHGGEADSVFDAARVLRAPGSVNHKDPEHPIPVEYRPNGGTPIRLDRLAEVLDSQAVEEPTDSEPVGTPWQGGEASEEERQQAVALLARLAFRLAETTEERNRALNTVAFILWHYVPHYLSEQEVTEALLDACDRNGLTQEDGKQQCLMSIRSGLKKGMSEPQKIGPGYDEEAILALGDDEEETTDRSQEPPRAKPTTRPALRKASDLRVSAPSRWLVRRHLPRGDVAVLVGEEGIGKSLWWVLVVAHVTTGTACPVLGIPSRAPADVALIITEDRWSDVRERLVLAGADLDRVHVLSVEDDGTGTPEFPRDFSLLIEAAETLPNLALVVVDAWLDTVHHTTTVKDPQQARQALHPWKEMANKTGACALLLAHSNRQDTTSIRDLIGATSVLRQKARALLFAATPSDRVGRAVYIGLDKANGTGREHAVEYRIDVEQVRPADDEDEGTVARLVPSGSAGVPMRSLLVRWRKAEQEATKPPSADEKAWQWLQGFLTEQGGECTADVAKAAARAQGHNAQRLAPVLKGHGGTVKPAGPSGAWMYALSQPDDDIFLDLDEGQA